MGGVVAKILDILLTSISNEQLGDGRRSRYTLTLEPSCQEGDAPGRHITVAVLALAARGDQR